MVLATSENFQLSAVTSVFVRARVCVRHSQTKKSLFSDQSSVWFISSVLVAYCEVGGLVSLNTERVKIGRAVFCTCRTEALLTHGFTPTVTASKGGRENGRTG